jgi:hypothetical protein
MLSGLHFSATVEVWILRWIEVVGIEEKMQLVWVYN